MFTKYFGNDAQEKIQSAMERTEAPSPQLRGGGAQYWVVKGKYEDVFPNIRTPVSRGKFDVWDDKSSLAGLCDSTLVPRDLFPGAIWANNGRIYKSKVIPLR